MIRSMTGFGRGIVEANGRRIVIELKSVNHRYLDLSFRMPKHIAFIEDALRQFIGNKVSRGHLDVFVSYKNMRNDARAVTVDVTLLSAYLESARDASKLLGLTDDLTLSNALRLPDVTVITEADEDRDAVVNMALTALEIALDELICAREAEGVRLYPSFMLLLDSISVLKEKIAVREPQIVREYSIKLRDRINALLVDTQIDDARLALEVAVFSDKASIHEELVRISSHIHSIRELLNDDEVMIGRKLDFAVQELNREFNTIGSKANDIDITNCVLAAKSDIEKMREQIQNIE